MILPEDATITIFKMVPPDASYTLVINDIRKTNITQAFDRMEFDFNRQRTSQNKLGQRPLLTTLLGNTPAQIVIGSVGSEMSFADPVPLGPDVLFIDGDSNFSNVKKKFITTKYDIQGSIVENEDIIGLTAIFASHLQELDRFQAYILQSGSMETEYKKLKDYFQAFSDSTLFGNLGVANLTESGWAVTGNVLDPDNLTDQEIKNVLITSFNSSVAHEVLLDEEGDDYELLHEFSLSFETRVVVPLDYQA